MLKRLIILDAGHGGTDPGACSKGRRECDRTLAYVKTLASLFDKNLYEVYLTRSSDEFKYLQERASYANSLFTQLKNGGKIIGDVRQAVFISIHMNSFNNPSANGVETWVDYATNKSRPLAEKVQAAVAPYFHANRGLKECPPNCRFTVLSHTNMIAMLLELGFISNETDYITNVQRERAICLSIVNEVNKYFGKAETEVKPAPPQPSKPVVKEESKLEKILRAHPISFGDSGTYVYWVQSTLKALGKYTGPIDGRYGPSTKPGSLYQAIGNINAMLGFEDDHTFGPACYHWTLTQ